MKAVGFFCAVFLSMLLVFLLATGEFKRWFSQEEKAYRISVDVSGAGSDGRGNNVHFDVYNVELGRRSFTIDAEFRQEDIQIESQLEDLRELTLGNGRIEVPVVEDRTGLTKPGGEPTASNLVKDVTIRFQSATCRRLTSTGRKKGQFEVLLRDGKGSANDGTDFTFEELTFTNRRPDGVEAEDGTFYLRSAKQVSVRNPSLQLLSPNGFEGTLRSQGLETLTFLPPVSAVFDPNQPSLLKLEPSALGGADVDLQTDTLRTREDAEAPAQTKSAKSGREGVPDSGTATADTRIAVSCQGPLSLIFQEKKRSSQATAESASTSTRVRFQKDVVIYAVEGPADAAALPKPEGSRFECQELEIELDSVGQNLLPRRAVAKWEGGRVRAVVYREPGGQPYTIDGERLEWELRPPGAGEVKASRDAAATAGSWGHGSPPGAASQAMLNGRPTLRGPNMSFLAERAIFLLNESRVLLQNVSGTLEYALTGDKIGEKAIGPEDHGLLPPRIDPWEGEPVEPPLAPVSVSIPAPVSADGKVARSSKAEMPRQWDMKADEAEFLFHTLRKTTTAGAAPSPGQALSRLVARSSAPAGVVISSRPRGKEGTVARDVAPDREAASAKDAVQAKDPVQAEDAVLAKEAPLAAGRAARDGTGSDGLITITGKTLTYVEGEKKATLEGSDAAKPRFTRCEDWIEAKNIHVLVDEELVWFDGDVRGRIKETAAQGDLHATGSPEPQSRSFELTAASLTVRRHPDKGTLRDIWGKGGQGSPVSLSCLSRPWFRLAGPEFYWEQERQVAQLRCSQSGSERPSMAPAPSPPSASQPAEAPAAPGARTSSAASADTLVVAPEVARVEFENGELSADKIQFDQARWKAYLSDKVKIRVRAARRAAPGDILEINTARAVVEFFPNLEDRGPEEEGAFKHLGRIKKLHATQSAGRPIEIRGETFVGRAEECTWDSGARELRFYGSGLQEIEILRDDFRGPIRAREIVYAEPRNLVILRGDVQGRLTQTPSPTGITEEVRNAQITAASQVAASGQSSDRVTWQFDTSLLEIKLERESGSGKMRLESFGAKDKILLRNDALRIQLRGDDLLYEESTRKVHIFSRDGRPQTLICDRFGNLGEIQEPKQSPGGSTESVTRGLPPIPAATPGVALRERGADPAIDKVHKIGAQEIWLLLYENPHASSGRGDPQGWLLVEFQRDVMASFYLPPSESTEKLRSLDLGETWKMVAEKLTLHIDPAQASGTGGERMARNLIPWAFASGKVVFSSGSYQATADRAVYEDALSRVKLIGAPARLARDSQTVEASSEILIRKVGSTLEYSPAGRQASPVVPSPSASER